MPAHEIKLLPLIEIELESSFLVLARNMGIRTRVPTWGALILGNPAGPILVDTGVSDPEIMERLHMTGYVGEGQGLDAALAAHGLERGDIRAILHTHTHIAPAREHGSIAMSTPL